MKQPTKRVPALAAAAVGALLVLSACGGGDIEQSGSGSGDGGDDQAAECGDLSMAVNPWVGYQASAYVVGELVASELGCKVQYRDLKEEVSWAGFSSGDVDVVIEDWGHPDLEKQYFAKNGDGSAEDFGPNGNEGVIGWYVPPWLAEEQPEITDWKNLNKFAQEFATSESGGQGQFLGSDPSYVQFDEAIIKNLDLDFKVVFSGSEAASISAFKKAEQNKEWLIGYFYEPQWFMSEVPLVKVDLPPYEPGCQEPASATDCDYPVTELKKIVSTKWAESGSPAVDVVQNFKWTNEDQNTVAAMISSDGMAPEDAAMQWIEDNPDTVEAWMPS
ncbi:ABC transporter substrate-binding protein [soil metagenome]